MHSLLKNIRSNDLPVDLSIQLFDSLVAPIPLYCCEIWGHEDFNILEKFHLRFCKLIPGVPKATLSYIVYGELGRLSYFVNARMIRFLGKIITSENSKLCRTLYNSIVPKIDEDNPNNRNRKFKWFRHIHTYKLLQELGYLGLWMTHDFRSIDWLHRSIQLRLKDNFLQGWAHSNGSSLKDYYLYIKTTFGLEEYLVKLPDNQRILIFRIRASLLGIPVTLGRYDQTSYDQRACNICNSGDIGDEYDFLLECQTAA